ncbi:MAG: hypothetical protein R3Y43_03475 [Alphaproteobacteria bacterium]
MNDGKILSKKALKRKNIKQTKSELGNMLFELRREKKMTLQEMSEDARFPLKLLDKFEMGIVPDIRLCDINHLAFYYGKKVEIHFV